MFWKEPKREVPVAKEFIRRLPDGETLKPGNHYRAWDHHLWVCFRVDLQRAEHMRAACVRVADGRVEDFYLDGRYDMSGTREHCLIQDMTAWWES